MGVRTVRACESCATTREEWGGWRRRFVELGPAANGGFVRGRAEKKGRWEEMAAGPLAVRGEEGVRRGQLDLHPTARSGAGGIESGGLARVRMGRIGPRVWRKGVGPEEGFGPTVLEDF